MYLSCHHVNTVPLYCTEHRISYYCSVQRSLPCKLILCGGGHVISLLNHETAGFNDFEFLLKLAIAVPVFLNLGGRSSHCFQGSIWIFIAPEKL